MKGKYILEYLYITPNPFEQFSFVSGSAAEPSPKWDNQTKSYNLNTRTKLNEATEYTKMHEDK